MTSEHRLIITKVPLGYTPPRPAPNFEPQPELYLELLENKDKVRPDLLDGSWSYSPSRRGVRPGLTRPVIFDDDDNIGNTPFSSTQPVDEKRIEEFQPIAEEEIHEETDVSRRIQEDLGISEGEPHVTTKKQPPPRQETVPENISDHSRPSNDVSPSLPTHGEPAPRPLSDIPISTIGPDGKPLPPMKSIGQSSSAEQESDLAEKRELIYKFYILKRSYSGANIPEVSEYTDLGTLRKTYEDIIRRLSLDTTVENYRLYLIGGFFFTEIAGTQIGLELGGFTQQQLININKYERLLIELGEKNHTPGHSKWPVEVRLVFTILGQAALFILGNLIVKHSPGLSDAFGSVYGSSPPVNPSGSPQRPRRKMRGPSISLDEIPDDLERDEEFGVRYRKKKSD